MAPPRLSVSTDEYQQPHLAVYCIVLDGRKVLMLRRIGARYASGFWSVPAGHVDEGESLLAAASRELEEETGLVADETAWSLATLMHRRTEDRTILDIFLTTRAFSGALVNREPSKHADLGFYEPETLLGSTIPYVARVLGPGRWEQPSLQVLEHGW